MIALWVAIGAAVGAPLRFLTDQAVQRSARSRLPLGTLTVNLVASFILGMVVGLHPSAALVAVIATGFCGSLSTYSTFSFETLRLAELNEYRSALGYVLLSVTAGCGLAALGWWSGAALG